MPKGPMNLPGPFGAMNPQVNAINQRAQGAFSGPQFDPIKNQMSNIATQAQPGMQRFFPGGQMPPQLQQMLQAIKGGGANNGTPQAPNASFQPQGVGTNIGTPQPPTAPSQPQGGGGFWNPNDGVQRPDISNSPSTTNPTTPFGMPQHMPALGGGIPPPPTNNAWTNFIPPPQSPNYNVK